MFDLIAIVLEHGRGKQKEQKCSGGQRGRSCSTTGFEKRKWIRAKDGRWLLEALEGLKVAIKLVSRPW